MNYQRCSLESASSRARTEMRERAIQAHGHIIRSFPAEATPMRELPPRTGRSTGAAALWSRLGHPHWLMHRCCAAPITRLAVLSPLSLLPDVARSPTRSSGTETVHHLATVLVSTTTLVDLRPLSRAASVMQTSSISIWSSRATLTTELESSHRNQLPLPMTVPNAEMRRLAGDK